MAELIGFVALVAVQVVIARHSQPPSAAATARNAKPDPKAADARFEQCRAALKKASAAGILHDLDWKPAQAPYVVAGPAYRALHSLQKDAFAANVNCFLAAGADDCIGFTLRDESERPIARYSLCRLEPIN